MNRNHRSWLGVVHTIYEEEDQEEVYSSDAGFDEPRPSISVQESSCVAVEAQGYSKYNHALSAKQNSLPQIVTSWSEVTGIPANVIVRIGCRTFLLHKFPLVSKSGLLKKELMKSQDIGLNPPGGADLFEMIAGYCYGCTVLMGPSSIVAIRCASEFYEMREQYYRGNLCRKSLVYFRDVVLKNWEDAIEALRSCEGMTHPIAKQLDIIDDCIEALACLACSEFVKQQQQQQQQKVSSIINDLTTLPFDYFKEILQSMRRQRGNYELFIGQALVLYCQRWVFDIVHLEAPESESKMRKVVESIVRLLPVEDEEIPAPAGFLFNLLRCALAWSIGKECRFKLEIRVAGQLQNARISDLILPGKKGGIMEIESMKHVLSVFLSQRRFEIAGEADCSGQSSSDNSSASASRSSSSGHFCSVCRVAAVWDEYLIKIAECQQLCSGKFIELLHMLPSSCRPVHDRLYKAIHIFLKNHPETAEAETSDMCRTLSCQKLSKETCFHAAQNDFLPLRMIVQAMYLHRRHIINNNNNSNNAMNSKYYYYSCNFNSNSNSNSRARATSNLNLNLNLASSSSPQNVCIPRASSHSSSRFLHQQQQHKSKAKWELISRQTQTLKSDLADAHSRLLNLEHEISNMRRKFNQSNHQGLLPYRKISWPSPQLLASSLHKLHLSPLAFWKAHKTCKQ